MDKSQLEAGLRWWQRYKAEQEDALVGVNIQIENADQWIRGYERQIAEAKAAEADHG